MESIRWPVIGVDESGKGDFFGPLVIAGVLIEEEQAGIVTQWGVRDSKTVTDKKVITLAQKVQGLCVWDVVVINPEKYNQLYGKIRNLNKLLGWGHARVIENLLTRKPAETAISDKFGDDRFILNSLQKQGKQVRLIQQVRAESHPAVAAASIIARAEFLRRMQGLEKQYNTAFPLGASATVDEAGRALVKGKGVSILEQVAKIHFKNYKKIMG